MRRILLVLISLICFLLQGCLYQKIDEVEIKKAVEFCKGNGGLRSITEDCFGVTKFYCNNGRAIFEYGFDYNNLKGDN